MANMTLRLHPVDVLMFRETRWFGTSAGASDSLFPVPRTIAGALRTYMMNACGMDYMKLRGAMQTVKQNAVPENYWSDLKLKLAEICGSSWPVEAKIIGPFLGRYNERYYPVPKTFVRIKTNASYQSEALRPVTLNVPSLNLLGVGQSQAWEALADIWIPEGSLTPYLNGGIAVPNYDFLEHGSKLKILQDEQRVGVAINSQASTADSGLLYTSTFTRLEKDWYLEVDIELDESGQAEIEGFAENRPWLRLGGDGKVARVEIVDTYPPISEPTVKGNPFIYLATPALFAGGQSSPSTLPGPSAAAIGKPLGVSGWDLATNLPMPSRYAVPAGSVFFYEQGGSLPHGECISDDANDSNNGWGYSLRGAW